VSAPVCGGTGLPPAWLAPPDIATARAAQLALAARVVTEDALPPVKLIAGVDISCLRFDPRNLIHAGIVVLRWPELEPAETVAATATASMPYIPGYLGFREVPALGAAWAKLTARPDLVMVDGHGIAHPRGFGVATHLGVVLDVPTIGVAKSPLVGEAEAPLGEAPGDAAPLVWKGARIGTVLRTKRRANPLWISPGHRISLATAVEWVRRCGLGYRLPEPTRLAHRAANDARRAAA
jgi:deoxyribonuclease V